jgi:hypothetical protein
MKKVLVLGLILLCLVVSSVAYGASARWQALGGENRFIMDSTNYQPYPARVMQYGNAAWLVPRASFTDNDISAGILMQLNPNMVGAFHFNLASAGATKLSSALTAYAGKNDRLAALQPRTFPDLFWGMKMGTTSLAARVSLAMDKSGVTTPAITTNASASDIYLGATMALPCCELDLGLAVGMQSFKDDNAGKITESTGGMGVSIDARINKPMGKTYTLVPIINVKLGSDPTEKDVTEVSYMGGDIGVGLRAMFEKKMVLIGALAGYSSVKTKPAGGTEVTATTLAPKVVMGVEIPVAKWLVVRGGANAELATKSNGSSSMDVKYYYNSGIRAMYGGFIVDLILARDIFHRGPYFVSGANSETANLAANICITYKF